MYRPLHRLMARFQLPVIPRLRSLRKNLMRGSLYLSDDPRAVVRRIVVHDDQLEVRKGLPEHAFYRGTNEARAVVHGDGNARERVFGMGVHRQTALRSPELTPRIGSTVQIGCLSVSAAERVPAEDPNRFQLTVISDVVSNNA